MSSTLIEQYFYDKLVRNFPKQWGRIPFCITPKDDFGKIYTSWREVYHAYVNFLKTPSEISFVASSRFSAMPRDILFNLFLQEKNFLELEKSLEIYCEAYPDSCEKVIEILWKRDFALGSPSKDVYFAFLYFYNLKGNFEYSLDSLDKNEILIKFGAFAMFTKAELPEDNFYIDYALESGQYEIFQFLVEKKGIDEVFGGEYMDVIVNIFSSAVEGQNLRIIRFVISEIKKRGLEIDIYYEILFSLVRHVNLEIIQLIYDNFPEKVTQEIADSQLYEDIIDTGNFDLFMYFYNFFYKNTDLEEIISQAVIKGNVNVFKFALEQEESGKYDSEFFDQMLDTVRDILEEEKEELLILRNEKRSQERFARDPVYFAYLEKKVNVLYPELIGLLGSDEFLSRYRRDE